MKDERKQVKHHIPNKIHPMREKSVNEAFLKNKQAMKIKLNGNSRNNTCASFTPLVTPFLAKGLSLKVCMCLLFSYVFIWNTTLEKLVTPLLGKGLSLKVCMYILFSYISISTTASES